MSLPPDYTRRRLALGGIAALMLVVGSRETPAIGSIRITMNHGAPPRVDAAWSPPLTLVICGGARVVALLDGR